MDTKDYVNIFEQSSELLVVIDTNFAIVAASDSFLKTTATVRENIVGRDIFEIFPDNPDDKTANGESIVRASFNRVIKNKTKDVLPVVKYDISKPESEGGGYELKYWQANNSPILDVNNNVKYIILRTEDVTENKILITQLNLDKKALKLFEDSEKRYNMMLMKSPFGFAAFKGENMVITLANDTIKEIWGKGKDVEGKPLFDVLPELKDTAYPGLLDNVYITGVPFQGNEILASFLSDGKIEDKYFNLVYQPYLEADDTISGVTVIAHEVTGQVILKKALAEQREAEKIAVRKIQASEERFRQLVLQAPVAICVMLGEEFVIETINQKMGNIWGRTIAEAINKPVFELLPEVITQGYKELLERVYKTGERYVSEESLVNFNRKGKLENVFVKFVYEPFRNSEGMVSGVMCLGHEITEQVNERKKIEKNEQRFQGAIAAVRGILWTNSASGEMIGEQLAWGSLTGQSYEEYQGFGWTNAIHPDDAQPTIDAWNEAVSEGKNFIFEHRVRLKNGNWGSFSIQAIPSLDSEGTIQEWIGVHTDITEQRHAEYALKSAFHQLEEAKSKAETATQIAESAVKAKQQFLSNMSHEIRTPMNSIIGFTNVVLKTELSKKQKEYLNAIKVSGDALIVLINDILDIAKVDAGKMTFEQIPFELSTSISATLHLFEPKIKEKNLELIGNYDAAIPEILIGDSVRLRQIMLNLLSNAVKFTDEGKITVSVRMLKEKADSIAIEFSVTDTGIGIPENKLEHIFDDFQQATNETSRLHGGTGLGLSIVKQFVELQGGNLFVNSKKGEGSTFGFILNFKKATAQTTEMAAITGTNNGVEFAERIENIKILVAEDMPLNQLLIKIILEDFGFHVDIASNGKIAIEKLQENKYHIILMDLQMPEMNGFEATKYIRSKMKSQIPIIALTADVTTVDVEKCRSVGMNDYISKPIEEKLLYSKIITYLKKTNRRSLS